MSVGSQAARFSAEQADERDDYSHSRPGAFASKSSQSRVGGMGGTTSRSSVFDVSAQEGPDVGAYDGAYQSTGAFAKAAIKGTSSAAFASRSGRFDRPTSATPGPDYGLNYNTMGAKKSFSRSGGGGFGSSTKRDTMAWGAKPVEPRPSDSRTPRSSRGPATSSEEAPLASSFTQPNRNKGPSAAFGGSKDRFAPTRQSTPGPGEYIAERLTMESKPASACLKSTMGSTERFAPNKLDERDDYSDARPSAFSKSKSQSRMNNTGFGGTSGRKSAFDATKSDAADTYFVGGGAFDKVSEGPSSAFSSKSAKVAAVEHSATPDPGSYMPHAGATMAANAGKSFNKSAQAGTGSFGTSVRRGGFGVPLKGADAPGPGAYDSIPSARVEATPSSAFASKSAKTVERRTDAPSVGSYDAYSSDGMAAAAAKTFNTKAGTSNFGSRSARQMHTKTHTPGAGEYAPSDPLRPTVESNINANRGKVSGSFASTALRDSSNWA